VRIANLGGRLVLIVADRAVDVFDLSSGRFGPSIPAVYRDWDNFLGWVNMLGPAEGYDFDAAALCAPTPRPTQVFGIGLNYPGHVRETGSELPRHPVVFTKFPTCISGPNGVLPLPAGDCFVDWEVELVVIIGRLAHRVAEADAWRYVAGITVGQDISDRHSQFAGSLPQFSLAKSHPGFGPMGPMLVTPDEVRDPNDLSLSCHLNGQPVQQGRTSEMLFSVPQIIAALSGVVPLLPGDAIFTGSPPGVGVTMHPPRSLQAGDVLVSSIDEIGEMRHVVAPPFAA
jgi:2-keto-4-pentenoate hydratase/2-oxohepta-3-ene-1,7-dioic acid hydratase in catechol pathway